MKRVVLYLRVSSDEQVRGTSLGSQEAVCTEFCKRNDMDVVRVFREEGESARTDDRPLFQDMVRFCTDRKNRVDHILVYKLDRFARNSTDYHVHTAALARAKVSVRSATEPIADDPVGHLLETVLSGIAQFDNDIRGERSKLGMKRIMERGGWNFQAPLGYRCARASDGLPILEPDPVTGPLVRSLFDAIASGRYTTVGIRDYATEIGLRSAVGKPLHVQTIYKMLRGPVYAGRIIGKLTNWQTVKAAFPPLILEDLFDRVQGVLAGQGHVPSPHMRGNPDFPLRRLLKCFHCGHALTASFATGGHGKRYGQYRCAQKACRGVNVRREVVEAEFLKLLTEIRIESTPLLQVFRNKILDQWQLRHAEVIAGQGLIKARAGDLSKQQGVLLDKMLRGIVDEATYQRKNAQLTEQLSVARAQLQDAVGDEFNIESAIDLACIMVQNAGRLWYQMKVLGHRQRLAWALFPGGLVYDQNQRFGTAANSWPVTALKGPDPSGNRVAPPRGIEPLFPG